MKMSSKSGTLWIIATPLGNPGDLSPRAREVLSTVAVVLAEDTRRSGLLAAQCNISIASFISFHDHNEGAKTHQVIDLLNKGNDIALISDAGTPLMSDPGFHLVRACRELHIRVSPIPGPCAPITALCASGLPPLPFTFLGFAPRKQSERKNFFLPFAQTPGTIIFFERKNRLKDTLAAAYLVLGSREACIARELTKIYEEFIPFLLEDYASLSSELLGEITVLIAPSPMNKKTTTTDVQNLIKNEIDAGVKPKDAAKNVQQQTIGWTAKEIYNLLCSSP